MSTRTWHLRPRPERLGKHRALPTITETDMPPQPAASLPLPEYRTAGELQQRALEPAFDPPADPSNPVQCVRCNAVDLVSNMRYDGRDWRCRDTSACTDRWYADGTYDPKPVSLVPHDTEALERLPVLPPGQEQALAAFNEAHDEHAAETLAKNEEPDEAAAEAPVPTLRVHDAGQGPALHIGGYGPPGGFPLEIGPAARAADAMAGGAPEAPPELPADTTEPTPVVAEPETQDGGEGE